jgi:hypothetical protein
MSTIKPQDSQPEVVRQRNRQTEQKHQHEVLWQITVPLSLGALVLLIFSVLVVLGTSDKVSQWADISVMWLSIPMWFFAFLTMIILAGLVYLIVRVIIELPFLFYRLLQNLQQFGQWVRNLSDRLAKPFIKYEGFKAAGRSGTANLKRFGSPPQKPDRVT